MNPQANDQTGRQVHAPIRRKVRRRDDLETDLALEDARPRASRRPGTGATASIGRRHPRGDVMTQTLGRRGDAYPRRRPRRRPRLARRSRQRAALPGRPRAGQRERADRPGPEPDLPPGRRRASWPTTVDRETIARIRSVRQTGTRVVLLARDLNGSSVLDTVNAGASAIVRRVEATDERLTEAIRVAAVGDGSLPRDLVNRLLHQVGASGAPSDAATARDTSLTHRELRILRLLADGLSTLEIARELAYSERTIKQAVHSMTTRLSLRNRSHAVAFAVRKGLI